MVPNVPGEDKLWPQGQIPEKISRPSRKVFHWQRVVRLIRCHAGYTGRIVRRIRANVFTNPRLVWSVRLAPSDGAQQAFRVKIRLSSKRFVVLKSGMNPTKEDRGEKLAVFQLVLLALSILVLVSLIVDVDTFAPVQPEVSQILQTLDTPVCILFSQTS